MKKTKLKDNTTVYCLKAPEAKMLDFHVEGYLQNGISIKENDVIFDVGANIGVFGIRAIQSKQNVQIYCFEPIPKIAEVLKANAELHGNQNIHVKQCGLSDEPGHVEFTYFPNTPALSTFKPEEWDRDPNSFNKAVKGTMRNPPPEMKWMRLIPTMFSPLIAKHLLKGKEQVKCELKTISSIIEEEKISKIDILKIDCEGAELGVIKGLKEEHWNIVKSLVIEVHDIDGRLDIIHNLIRSNNFKNIVVEREKGLENTSLFNVFATR